MTQDPSEQARLRRSVLLFAFVEALILLPVIVILLYRRFGGPTHP